jgi:hypothetical protein
MIEYKYYATGTINRRNISWLKPLNSILYSAITAELWAIYVSITSGFLLIPASLIIMQMTMRFSLILQDRRELSRFHLSFPTIKLMKKTCLKML